MRNKEKTSSSGCRVLKRNDGRNQKYTSVPMIKINRSKAEDQHTEDDSDTDSYNPHK